MTPEVRARLFAASPDHGGSHDAMVAAVLSYRGAPKTRSAVESKILALVESAGSMCEADVCRACAGMVTNVRHVIVRLERAGAIHSVRGLRRMIHFGPAPRRAKAALVAAV